ncbi:hypothetical protein J437_LFUL015239, partial [Ladona fulva]
MTPFDDFVYLINSILLGEEPTIEDFILLIGTFVAFIAFILWCCFPIVPKESNAPAHYDVPEFGGVVGVKTKSNSSAAQKALHLAKIKWL